MNDLFDENKAKELYYNSIGNHPAIHSNRFPTWDELMEREREVWRTIFKNGGPNITTLNTLSTNNDGVYNDGVDLSRKTC